MSDDECYQFSDGTPLEGNYEFDDMGIEDISIQKEFKKKKRDFVVVHKTDLYDQVQNDVLNTRETLETTEYETKVLLKLYNWNTEKLLEDFFDKGKDALFLKAGISSKETSQNSKEEEIECPACYEDVPRHKSTQLDGCGHRFCNECWKSYITNKIKDNIPRSTILCMHSKCNIVLSEPFIMNFVDEQTREKFENSLLEEYVATNKKIVWCPSKPFCGYAIKVTSDISTLALPIVCKCGCNFCFSCRLEAHLPATCEQMDKWNKKMKSDAGSLDWIESHTKKCPKCANPIEKNGGCNHMTCSRCMCDFCWICGSANFYNHSCGSNLNISLTNKQKRGKDFLDENERFYSHFKRYAAHNDSAKFEKKMRSLMIWKIQKDQTWLEFALDLLFACRRSLVYCYVYAFYSFDYSKMLLQHEIMKEKLSKKLKEKETKEKMIKSLTVYQNLFEEMYLKDLEKATEKLARLLEKCDAEELVAKKKDVMHLVDCCEKAAGGLYDVIKKQDMKELDF